MWIYLCVCLCVCVCVRVCEQAAEIDGRYRVKECAYLNYTKFRCAKLNQTKLNVCEQAAEIDGRYRVKERADRAVAQVCLPKPH